MRIPSVRRLLLAVLVLGAASAYAGRYDSFTKRFAAGPKMTMASATLFGGTGAEEYVGAGVLPDGSVVAFGNSGGPDFPKSPVPVVVGKGVHRGLNPVSGGKHEFRADNPDLAGMVVHYSADLQRVLGVSRFDWGVASFSSGCVSRDGKALLVAGRCTEAFRTLGPQVKVLETGTAPEAQSGKKRGPATGPYAYEGVQCPGDVFVARLSPAGDKVEWAWVFPGFRTPPRQIWSGLDGALYVSAKGFWRIPATGLAPAKINALVESGTASYHLVDPADGAHYFGGDRNTNTGYQPWRQPYLYKFDVAGKKLWKLWEWTPSTCACGGAGNGLCSDSSARAMEYAANGDLLVGGWSDGGNSVFGRQPTDLAAKAEGSGLGMDCSGMKGANSIGYLLRIDPKTLRQTAYALWVAYVPDNFVDVRHRGAPNFANVRSIKGLADNSVAITGSAATGLIQTPGAFVTPPADGSRYGGDYVAVFNSDLSGLLFSSYLPGIQRAGIAPAKQGLLVFGQASKGDEVGNPPPMLKAVQAGVQGEWDAWIAWVVPPRS